MDAPLHGVAFVRLEDPTMPLFQPTEHYLVFLNGQPLARWYKTYDAALVAFDSHQTKVAA